MLGSFPGGTNLPLYEYRCKSCGNSFEKIQKFSDEPEKECPKCGGELIRPVTAPALRFEGAGWYVNDYAGKGGAAAKPTEGSEAVKKDAPATESKPASSESSSASAPAAAPAANSSSTPSSTTPAS
jgi:putative FmdB family regulatory protein